MDHLDSCSFSEHKIIHCFKMHRILAEGINQRSFCWNKMFSFKVLRINNINYLLTESEVRTGNIKVRPYCTGRTMTRSIKCVSRPKFDTPVKTERSRLISIFYMAVTLITAILPYKRKFSTSHFRFCVRVSYQH